MSNELEESTEMGTKPGTEHVWLQNLVGEWQVETEMYMPGGEKVMSRGAETVTNLGGLWAFGSGHGEMPDGTEWQYYMALGYDVSFKEYRGSLIMSMSSHLWKYTGTLSDDRRTMTLDCVGPSMTKDGETALYRDIIELIDVNHRSLTSSGQDDDGRWQPMMRSVYTRV